MNNRLDIEMKGALENLKKHVNNETATICGILDLCVDMIKVGDDTEIVLPTEVKNRLTALLIAIGDGTGNNEMKAAVEVACTFVNECCGSHEFNECHLSTIRALQTDIDRGELTMTELNEEYVGVSLTSPYGVEGELVGMFLPNENNKNNPVLVMASPSLEYTKEMMVIPMQKFAHLL